MILALPVDQAGNSTITFSIKSSDVDTLKRILDARNLASLYRTLDDVVLTISLRHSRLEGILLEQFNRLFQQNERRSIKRSRQRESKLERRESLQLESQPLPGKRHKSARLPSQSSNRPRPRNQSNSPRPPPKPFKRRPVSYIHSRPNDETSSRPASNLPPAPKHDALSSTSFPPKNNSPFDRRRLSSNPKSRNDTENRARRILRLSRNRRSNIDDLSRELSKSSRRRRIDFLQRSVICFRYDLSFFYPRECTDSSIVQMISKSVGQTSIRTRKTKSTFELWATRKATEIERENHHQTFVDSPLSRPPVDICRICSGLTLQNMQQIIRRIHESNDRARHEIYEIQKSMGGEENGGAI